MKIVDYPIDNIKYDKPSRERADTSDLKESIKDIFLFHPFIIDKKGKLIDKEAPRPSSKEIIRKRLQELISEHP